MSLFDGLQSYAGKFEEKSRRNFTAEEQNAVIRAEVKQSDYGLSCCFFMKSGGQTYVPLDQNSSLGIGSQVDLTKAQLVTLQRPGEDDIYRVRA